MAVAAVPHLTYTRRKPQPTSLAAAAVVAVAVPAAAAAVTTWRTASLPQRITIWRRPLTIPVTRSPPPWEVVWVVAVVRWVVAIPCPIPCPRVDTIPCLPTAIR